MRRIKCALTFLGLIFITHSMENPESNSSTEIQPSSERVTQIIIPEKWPPTVRTSSYKILFSLREIHGWLDPSDTVRNTVANLHDRLSSELTVLSSPSSFQNILGHCKTKFQDQSRLDYPFSVSQSGHKYLSKLTLKASLKLNGYQKAVITDPIKYKPKVLIEETILKELLLIQKIAQTIKLLEELYPEVQNAVIEFEKEKLSSQIGCLINFGN